MTNDDAELYAEVCDVVERTLHDWPLDRDAPDDPGGGMLHTSSDARAAATRIFDVLVVRGDEGEWA